MVREKAVQFVECKSCGKDIALKAKACPYCGATRVRWARQRRYAAIAILIGILWFSVSYAYNVERIRHYVGGHPIIEECNIYKPDSGSGLLILAGIGWYVVSVCMDQESNKKILSARLDNGNDEGNKEKANGN